MPARRREQTKSETRLAALRVEFGLTQEQMAIATGISLASYWRLERGRINNPPLRYLVNCALFLGVDLDEVIEDEWRTWQRLPGGPGQVPDLERLKQGEFTW